MSEPLTHNADTLRDEFAPLYRRYPGQLEPQNAFIALDPERRHYAASYNGEIGNAVPMDVWHRRVFRIAIPRTLKGSAIADAMEDPELVALLEKICDGYSVEWDGSNHKGCLTEEAEAALEAAHDWLAELEADDSQWGDSSGPHVMVYAPDDWLHDHDVLPRPLPSTEEGINDLAAELEAEALVEGVLIDGDIAAYLTTMRKREEEAAEEEEYALDQEIYEYIARLDREEAEIAMRLEENDEPQ